MNEHHDGGEAIVYLAGLADLGVAAATVAGTKAATLADLSRAGFPVPDGFVVSVSACARVAAEGGLPNQLRPALAAALSKLGAPVVAVRSSAVAEDSASASYAGQYASVLGVANDTAAVAAAITRVVASASSDSVRAYRLRAGTDDAGIAVLVQRQLAPDAAGVAFTADPVTGDRDRTLVSAVRGLGDQLMSGVVTPEEWSVRDGTAVETSPSARARGGALTSIQATKVAAVAERIAARAGVACDIEWVLVDDVVHVVQARPITALPVPPEVDLPPGTWLKERGRRAELVTPFGASVALPIVSDGLAAAFAEAGSLIERIEMRSIGGEVYSRIVPVGARPGPSGGPPPRASGGPPPRASGGPPPRASGGPPPWWLLGILSRVAPPLRKRCRSARFAIAAVDSAVREWTKQQRPAIVEASRRLRAFDVTTMSDGELAAHLDETIALMRQGLALHFALVPAYALAIYELVSTCRELFGWSTLQTLELLAGYSEATSEPNRALARVAASARNSASLLEALRTPGGARHLQELDQPLASAFADWRETYAWRVLGEDPGAPTLAEQPRLLFGLLRDALGETVDFDEVERRRKAAIERARSRLAGRSGADRDRFEDALAVASRVYPTREDSGLWGGSHPAGLVRRTVVEIGRRLARAGQLEKPDDVVMLDVDTVRAAIRGGARDFRPAVSRARAHRAWVRAHPGPLFYGPPPGAMPDVRGLPAAARRMNEAMMWVQEQQRADGPASGEHRLRGAAGSPGQHSGPVRVVRAFDGFDRVQPGEVLVCPATDPSWSVLFATIGAVVTEAGGALSHSAIVAREHGIPAVLGIDDATRVLRDGEIVAVDGTAGTVAAAESAVIESAKEKE